MSRRRWEKRRFRIAFFRGERPPRRVTSHTHTHHFHYSRKMEQTYIMIKPDGVQRGLVGKIIQRFEEKGFFLRGMKMMQVEKAHAEKHYADLSSKPFFGDLVDYMCSGPVVCMVWEGKEVVKTGRKIIGATNPLCVTPPTLALSSAIRSVPALRRQLRPPLRDAREHAPIAPRRAASHRTDAANFPRRVPWREPTDDPPLTRSAPLRSAPLPPQRLRARHHPRRLLHRAWPQRHPRFRRRRVRPARDRPVVPRGCHLLRALRQGLALRVNAIARERATSEEASPQRRR